MHFDKPILFKLIFLIINNKLLFILLSKILINEFYLIRHLHFLDDQNAAYQLIEHFFRFYHMLGKFLHSIIVSFIHIKFYTCK